MISYDALRKTMADKNITQYKLIFHYGFSTSLINRLKHNRHVTTATLEKLCSILDCNISDIVNYYPSEEKETDTNQYLVAYEKRYNSEKKKK